MSRRGLLLGGIVVGMIAVLVVVGGPAGEDPTDAFVGFLRASGIPTETAPRPPGPPGTFVLLADGRSIAEERPLLDWVSRGGRLVIADPTSTLAADLRVGIGERVGLAGTTTLAPGCPDPLAVGVEELVVDAADRTLHATEPGDVSCFVRPGGSFVVVTNRGSGSVVVLGGWSFLSNGLLDHGDNAVAVLRLVGPGPVVVGPAIPPGSAAPNVWDLLPAAARAVIVGSIVAAAWFAVARARRLGRPVEEPIPAPIPASALVEATAGLYRRARATGYCGRIVRGSARTRLARAVGDAPDVDADRLVTDVSRAFGIERARVLSALSGAEPAGEDELLRLVTELNLIVARATGEPRDAAIGVDAGPTVAAHVGSREGVVQP